MNSELYNNVYNIPDEILNKISISLQKFRKVNTNGKKRAKNLLQLKTITYQSLKRLKNYFDALGQDHDVIEFELNGGNLMKNFVNNLLKSEREKLSNSKDIKTNLAGFTNQYNKSHEKLNLVNRENNFIKVESNVINNLKIICLGIIVKNSKVLLFKRSENDDWCPNKFAYVGGTGEQNETPEETLKREIKEEIGVELIDYTFKKIVVNKFNMEYLYLIDIDDSQIKLNNEHSEHKYFDVDYIKNNSNEFVPDVLKYLTFILK